MNTRSQDNERTTEQQSVQREESQRSRCDDSKKPVYWQHAKLTSCRVSPASSELREGMKAYYNQPERNTKGTTTVHEQGGVQEPRTTTTPNNFQNSPTMLGTTACKRSTRCTYPDAQVHDVVHESFRSNTPSAPGSKFEQCAKNGQNQPRLGCAPGVCF